MSIGSRVVLGGVVVSLWQLPAGCTDRPNADVCPYSLFVMTYIEAAHDAMGSKGLKTTGIRTNTITRFF